MKSSIVYKSSIALVIIILSTPLVAQTSSSGGAVRSDLNQIEQTSVFGGGDIIRKIPLPQFNRTVGIEWVHDTLYVLSQAINDTSAAVLQKIDPINGNIVSQFSLPFTGFVLDMTFDSKNLWIVKWLPTQEIYHITREGNIISSFPAPGAVVRGIAWDGQYLWIGESYSKIFYKVDTLGNVINNVTWTNLSGVWPMGIVWINDHSAGHLWVNTDLYREIFQLNVTDSITIVQRFPFPPNSPTLPEGICYDGEYLWVADFYVDTLWQIDDGIISGIQENNFIRPQEFLLSQSYPNPFNPTTAIKYHIPVISFITLIVYDVLGNQIETLVNEEQPAGTYEITWYAENLPSGIYFYRIKAGDFVETKKMVLLK